MDTPYRIERKFVIRDLSHRQVLEIIRLHPSRFTDIYHVRRVNNIYFDTITFSSFLDHVNGETTRINSRVRWYGETSGTAGSPTLEFKIKTGMAGKKVTFPLKNFSYTEPVSAKALSGLISDMNVPPFYRQYLHSVYPVFLNSYSRKYFISCDKKFRLTMDSDLVFFPFCNGKINLKGKFSDDTTTTVEMKYKPDNDEEARVVTSAFPFPVTKSSKYVRGVQYTYF